jgi:hypothetical protein
MSDTIDDKDPRPPRAGRSLETFEEIQKVHRLIRESRDALERLPFPFAKAGQRAVVELTLAQAVFEHLAKFWERHIRPPTEPTGFELRPFTVPGDVWSVNPNASVVPVDCYVVLLVDTEVHMAGMYRGEPLPLVSVALEDWRGWVELFRAVCAVSPAGVHEMRSEIAALREHVKKLEAGR